MYSSRTNEASRPGRSSSSTRSTIQPLRPMTRPWRTKNTWNAASRSSSARPMTSRFSGCVRTISWLSRARRAATSWSRSLAARSYSCRSEAARISRSSRREDGALVARQEVGQGLDVRAVGLLGHAGDVRDARPGAPADVVVQAGPPGPGPLVEEGVGAGPDGEHAGQRVEGLADGVGVGVRARSTGRPCAWRPADLGPGPLLPHREREVRVGLVVPVADVEPGPVLLDQVVLEHQGVDLVRRDDPLHRLRGRHHGLGPGVERLAPVAGQALAERLGLAHVDHAAVRVPEKVGAGRVGDGRGIGAGDAHAPILGAGPAASEESAAPPRYFTTTCPVIVGWTSQWKKYVPAWSGGMV